MKTLKTISCLVETSTNEFNNSSFLFFNECRLAYNIINELEPLGDFENTEKWTDIVLDNSDPLNRRFLAVYGEGSVTSKSKSFYVEVEPSESLLEQVFSILPE
jgi:hypothetical protein